MYKLNAKVTWQNMTGTIIKITGKYIHVRFFTLGVGAHRFLASGQYEGDLNGERLEVVE